MPQTIKNLFKKLKNIEPSQGLEGKILKSIVLKKSRKTVQKLLFVRGGLAASFGALVYTLLVFGRAFLASDFWNLAKLAYSDTDIIAKNFGNFSVSLLETLPVIEISVMLVPVFAAAMILSWYFRFSNNHLRHNHLT
jgi:hypothetical protein